MTWKVKTFLAKRSLRLRDIAEQLGTSEALISKILSGEHKGYIRRPRLAALLGITEATLAREIEHARRARRATSTTSNPSDQQTAA